MSGLLFEMSSEELENELTGMVDRIQNEQVLLVKAGAIVRESVRTNFAVGGRPDAWQPLNSRDGQPLRDTGRLQNSITSTVGRDVVYVGTNVVYAAVQHFEVKKGSFGDFDILVPAHDRTRNGKTYHVREYTRRASLPWGDIPARPFMLVQDEDLIEIEAMSARYIVEGK